MARARVAAKVQIVGSGGRTLFDGGSGFTPSLQSPGMIICKQSLKVVAEWAVAVKGVFIEKTLDTATSANLVGATLRADRPAHLTVPAASKQHCGTRHSRRQQAHGPEPARALVLPGTYFLFLFHCKPEYNVLLISI
jgi:hypothetical protein